MLDRVRLNRYGRMRNVWGWRAWMWKGVEIWLRTAVCSVQKISNNKIYQWKVHTFQNNAAIDKCQYVWSDALSSFSWEYSEKNYIIATVTNLHHFQCCLFHHVSGTWPDFRCPLKNSSWKNNVMRDYKRSVAWHRWLSHRVMCCFGKALWACNFRQLKNLYTSIQ